MVDKGRTKLFLDAIYETYNKREYVVTDPLRFAYEVKGNTEFIAFTSALFAYGNVKAITGFLKSYFAIAGSDPLKLNTSTSHKLYYRFQSKEDISEYSKVMKGIYKQNGSLLNLFKKYNDGRSYDDVLKAGIVDIRSRFDTITKGINFLLPIPGKSASKRLTMFMRWVIRHDDVDLGLWKRVFDKKLLAMPIDVHIKRSSVSLGIVSEKTTPKISLKKISEYYATLSPDDPAKYDFALSRLGIAFDCQYTKSDNCKNCKWVKKCVFADIICKNKIDNV